MVLSFKFNEKYPDDLPEIVIEETENVLDEEELLEFLKNNV